MKRGSFFKRILLVNGFVVLSGICVGILTVNAALAPPPPAISPEQFTADSLNVCRILSFDSPCNPYTSRLDSMPPGGIRLDVPRNISHGRVFNDSNYLHLNAASTIGLSPIESIEDAWNIDRPIVKVESCSDFFVDNLTHSLPYLVPEADNLLHDIGRSFRDSLLARGGGDYRVKVTSILRTRSSIKKLRRRNRNAVGGSAHLYGTTFDLSYSNFACDSLSVPRTTEDLKLLLAEILINYRDEGRCYVKHERKQSCFHITCRE